MRRTLTALSLLLLTPALAAQELACPQFEFGGTQAPAGEAGSDGKLVITADEAELSQEGLSTLEGTVRLRLGGNEFEAQSLAYDEQQRRIRIDSESLFRSRSLVVRSRSAEFDLATESGVFGPSEFTLVQRAARGGAERIELSRDGTARIEDVYYTTCAPGSRAWFLEASDIRLDQQAGFGTAKHARLRFGYVPILYAPWFRFPIDDRRSSGFLFPTLGESDTTGLDLRAPFYLNLAPNYDATLTPRYMSRRGAQLGADGRYLLRNATGRALVEYLEEDEQRGEARSHVAFQHEGLLNRRLALDARYAEVSDQEYFEELGSELESASITHLERSARLTYAAPTAYEIAARVTDYQRVARSVTAPFDPHRREPEVRIDALMPNPWLGLRLGFHGEYVSFTRETPPEGQRLDLRPYLRLDRDETAWYLASQADWRYTRYRVDAPAGQPPDVDRSLPVFSAETGLRFDREVPGGALQTLEPRLFYLYVPYRDQDDLPVFDSGEPDFDFVQLFARNRFSGEDRISDANHLTGTVTTRLLRPDDGSTLLAVSMGQIVRFKAPQLVVTQNGTLVEGFSASAPDQGGTDFIAEAEVRPVAPLALGSSGQWSPDTGSFVRSAVAVRWLGERLRTDLSYRYRRGIVIANPAVPGTTQTIDMEQADASALVPLWGGLSSIGRWRYSIEERRSLEAFGGLEYQTCCWAVRAAYRRYQFSFEDAAPFQPRYTTGLYLQLELTGLTRIGAGFEALIPALRQ